MSLAEPVIDIFLQPGDFYFGGRETRIRTLLGSCVSITVWHPYELIGGMCHYVLPSRPHRPHGHPFDGRYADEAVAMMLMEIEAAGTRPQEYQVKMFGAGRQFAPDSAAATIDISERNLQTGLELLKRHGLELSAMHLGGTGHRQVILDLSSGVVWMRHEDYTDHEDDTDEAVRR